MAGYYSEMVNGAGINKSDSHSFENNVCNFRP
jgi:hypothetical protein